VTADMRSNPFGSRDRPLVKRSTQSIRFFASDRTCAVVFIANESKSHAEIKNYLQLSLLL